MEVEMEPLSRYSRRTMSGRKPKIEAPPGHRGCAKCRQILLLTHPTTGESNFAPSGYCKPCARAASAAHRREKRNAAALTRPARITPGLDFAQLAFKEEQMSMAAISPFPELNLKPTIRCSCCYSAPTQTVHGKGFCDRCGYYVSACGRCLDHANREHITELLHHPAPPLLPPFVAPRFEHHAPPAIDEDELDAPDRLIYA